MIANIILTIAGTDTGPFNLYSNIDTYGVPFATGISRSILETGYTSTMVPDGTTIVKVLSTGVCTTDTYANVVLLPITTTTTTTVVGVVCGTPTNYGGGTSYPSVETIALGPNLGNVVFNFDAVSVPDKFEVWFDGVKVIDTGYRGSTAQQTLLNAALTALGDPTEIITSPGDGTVSFNKTTATTTAEVRVYAPLSSTYWSFTMECPV